MKIGDKFKHTATDSVYMFVGESGSNAIRILDLKSGKTLSCFDNNIDDPYNITKEDFRRIIAIKTLPEYPIYSDMNGQPLFPEPTYSYGDDFIVVSSDSNSFRGVKFKLCQIDSGVLALINLNTGNRFSDGIEAENCCEVTESELIAMMGTNATNTRIQKVA